MKCTIMVFAPAPPVRTCHALQTGPVQWTGVMIVYKYKQLSCILSLKIKLKLWEFNIKTVSKSYVNCANYSTK